ncbi:hypothetical protein M5689_019167 [Euphorbia peplus]|nr:hypothetical protein M5689_019167 [Euphorbia peplus]
MTFLYLTSRASCRDFSKLVRPTWDLDGEVSKLEKVRDAGVEEKHMFTEVMISDNDRCVSNLSDFTFKAESLTRIGGNPIVYTAAKN